MNIPEFAKGATNVYRTKHFIVKQRMCFRTDMKWGEELMSYDTYYNRTPKRDEAYKIWFADRKRINGKRLTATVYSREYVE